MMATPVGIDVLMATTAKVALEDASAKARGRPVIISARPVKVGILASTVAKRASVTATPPAIPSLVIASAK